MNTQTTPWVRGRGLARLLAVETNVSDLLQFLSDRDSSPWAEIVSFVPDDVDREVLAANRADLRLTSSSRTAVVEVKVGHTMSTEQQERYEALGGKPNLYLAALTLDKGCLPTDSDRWTFLGLADLVGRWQDTDDALARLIAAEAAKILHDWDRQTSAVFGDPSSDTSAPLSTLNQKFLGRVVTRRLDRELKTRGYDAWAGVTSGGGLPVVQAWTPVRDEEIDRAFIAEVRWRGSKAGGDLRFGVDFDPASGQTEDEEVRRAAYDLARSMDTAIDYSGLRAHLVEHHPKLAALLRRDTATRPTPKGDWERVIVHGFAGAPLEGGKKNNRQRTRPDFYGDGTLRYQAIVDVDFDQATASDLTELIDVTLSYLTDHQP